MTKVEAETLEEAYQKASKVLECSISELQCEVVQHPSKGILGLFKKNAIIVAICVNDPREYSSCKLKKKEVDDLYTPEENVAAEIITTVREDNIAEEIFSLDSAFEKDAVMDSFFETDDEEIEEENVVYTELALIIENQLKEMFSHACFDIDVVEVDVRDNIALIFIDGNDAALLIGKEGYRYNALSYMLFSWLHTKYELFIKLEIAEFLTTQEEMIKSYMKPVIETVESTGRAKTRFLDGILVQIALEQLRAKFPDKYVAVKTSRDGKKFVVINEFTNKSNG